MRRRGETARQDAGCALTIRTASQLHVVRLCPRSRRLAVAGVAGVMLWALTATSLLVLQAGEALTGAPPAAVAASAGIGASDAALARARAEARIVASVAALADGHDALVAETAAREALAAEVAGLRARVADLTASLVQAEQAASRAEAALGASESARIAAVVERDEIADTLHRLSLALDATAVARDDAEAQTVEFVDALGALEAGVEAERDRQARLLGEIERAAELSIVPLQSMLDAAGVNVERIIEELRREDGASGGPFVPAGDGHGAAPDRAAAVIADLQTVRLLQTAAKRMPFAAPVVNPRFTSGFGVRRDPFNRRLARHDGLDMAGPVGTPVLAPADGVVTFAGVQRGYGRMVKIRHQFGFETVYAHLSKLRVREGQTVRRGARLGDMGSTGRSTGSHLHYEIHVDGKPVNPRKFIEAARNVL